MLTIFLFSSLCDFLSLLFVFIKIYRIICFAKLTFDQLPLFNPYRWPLSFIRLMTKPYFAFWAQLIPAIKLGRGSYDISAIVGLEALSSISLFSSQLKLSLLSELERIINSIN
jgi:hypothetical protein